MKQISQDQGIMYFWIMENIAGPILTLTRDSFGKPSAGKHSLGIHFAGTSVNLLAMTNDCSEVLALRVLQLSEPLNWQNEQSVRQLLDYLLAEQEWFADPSLKITALIPGTGFTLVPEEIFDTYSKEQILEPQYQVQTGEIVHSEKLNSIPAMAVYTLPVNADRLLKNRFSDLAVVHEDVFWMDQCIKGLKDQLSSPSLVLLTGENYIKILIINNKKVQFFNSFSTNSNDDVLYYTQLAIQQNKLEAAGTRLFFAGTRSEDNELITYLAKYFPNCSLLNLPWFSKLTSVFNKKVINTYLPVFSITTCG